MDTTEKTIDLNDKEADGRSQEERNRVSVSENKKAEAQSKSETNNIISSKFTASILYNVETIKKLQKMINSTMHSRENAVRYIVALVLIVYGVFQSSSYSLVLVILGCLLFSMGDMRFNATANRTLEAMKNKELTVRYTFEENQFIVEAGGESNNFQYKNMKRIVDDGTYLYLFPNKMQAFMIDRKKVHPHDLDRFKNYLKEQIGLEWTSPVSFFHMNLRQLIFNRKNTRR